MKCENGFESWSVCATCSKSGSNLCPLENNKTIQEIKGQIRNLESRINYLENERG